MTITALTLIASGRAPLWIAGWIIVIALAIGLPLYLTRKRRGPDR